MGLLSCTLPPLTNLRVCYIFVLSTRDISQHPFLANIRSLTPPPPLPGVRTPSCKCIAFVVLVCCFCSLLPTREEGGNHEIPLVNVPIGEFENLTSPQPLYPCDKVTEHFRGRALEVQKVIYLFFSRKPCPRDSFRILTAAGVIPICVPR